MKLFHSTDPTSLFSTKQMRAQTVSMADEVGQVAALELLKNGNSLGRIRMGGEQGVHQTHDATGYPVGANDEQLGYVFPLDVAQATIGRNLSQCIGQTQGIAGQLRTTGIC